MIQVDLITGFLGAGKTTFIKRYAKSYIDLGQKICILENDFGAVNVDMMLLQDLGKQCELEMIAGGCDAQTHIRRMKTKLISMGMRGFHRVIVEPSGIFDVDEFFDLLHEEPLNQWYEIGNVMTLVDANIDKSLSRHSRYILTSQLADAGKIILSKVDETSQEMIDSTKQYLQSVLNEFHCQRQFNEGDFFIKDYREWNQDDFALLQHCGYQLYSYMKIMFDYSKEYNTQYFMNLSLKLEHVKKVIEPLMNDETCGHIMRIKGFVYDQKWYEINATHKQLLIKPIDEGQDVIIVIGENLCKEKIEKYFRKDSYIA